MAYLTFSHSHFQIENQCLSSPPLLPATLQPSPKETTLGKVANDLPNGNIQAISQSFYPLCDIWHCYLLGLASSWPHLLPVAQVCIRTPHWNSSRPPTASQPLDLTFPYSLTLAPWACSTSWLPFLHHAHRIVRCLAQGRFLLDMYCINEHIFHSHIHASAHTHTYQHTHYPSLGTHSLASTPRIDSPCLLAPHQALFTAIPPFASRGQAVPQSQLDVEKFLPKILPSP